MKKTQSASIAKSTKTWQLNNRGCVQASVVLSMSAAAKLTNRAEKAGIRPLDFMAGILEQAAKKEGKVL